MEFKELCRQDKVRDCLEALLRIKDLETVPESLQMQLCFMEQLRSNLQLDIDDETIANVVFMWATKSTFNYEWVFSRAFDG